MARRLLLALVVVAASMLAVPSVSEAGCFRSRLRAWRPVNVLRAIRSNAQRSGRWYLGKNRGR